MARFGRQLGRSFNRFGRQLQGNSNIFARQLVNTAKDAQRGIDVARRQVSRIEAYVPDVPIAKPAFGALKSGLSALSGGADVIATGGQAIRDASLGDIRGATSNALALSNKVGQVVRDGNSAFASGQQAMSQGAVLL
jgi:hypothetical protein